MHAQWLLSAFFIVSMMPGLTRAGLAEGDPTDLGMDPDRLARIDGAIERAIEADQVPGAVVVVGRRGRIAYVRAAGLRAVEPVEEAMTRETRFDLASLTKPVATATSVMLLLERGRIRLDDPIGRHLPEIESPALRSIAIEQLLRHRSGLIPDNPISDYADGPERAWNRIEALEPRGTPGERFVYSDVNFLILGRLVERIAGMDLDRFALENVFEPLGMDDTGFLPIADGKPVDLARIAPTEAEGETRLRGVVHDPRSRALGGVAGHAGLFGTADDLAVFAQMLLDGGTGTDGHRILAPMTVRAMIDPDATPDGQRRGLGWDIQTGYSSPKGALFGPSSFGHTGFTGTSLWIDPETETFVIVLTSRLHPDGKAPAPSRLRAEVATLAAAAIVDGPSRPLVAVAVAPAPKPQSTAIRPVACGIDVLAEGGFAILQGKRVGLVTNHTGLAGDGTPTIDVLVRAEGVELVVLFSPEHGIRGLVDAEVPDARDERTGLPILSLYGKTRKPTPESLEGVDVLVFDIQDIGARFYTYISTLGLVLEAAKEKGIPIVVLDRPNPIGGLEVSGPVRDDEFESFIAHHALPVRHGMTVGELARLFNAERGIGADLTVVPCRGWRRADLFDRTGLLWVNPSPNMRSPTEALLYPGVGLLEGTNLATGRGTDTPFERLGAPWIEPRSFASALNDLGLSGIRFVPIRFTPTIRQYAGEDCGGVLITVTDWDEADPMEVFLAVATVLRGRYADDWKPEALPRFLADRASYQAILDGQSPEAIRAVWQPELEQFRRIRAPYLLYR